MLAETPLAEFPSDECHLTLLMVNHHWPRLWLGSQYLPNLCQHTAPLSHNDDKWESMLFIFRFLVKVKQICPSSLLGRRWSYNSSASKGCLTPRCWWTIIWNPVNWILTASASKMCLVNCCQLPQNTSCTMKFMPPLELLPHDRKQNKVECRHNAMQWIMVLYPAKPCQ